MGVRVKVGLLASTLRVDKLSVGRCKEPRDLHLSDCRKG